eukprot:m.334092 g.334092  ORF g.334092 m.334092 type:complete len:327 (-) comp17286_c0_seq1:2665-3645(-)
MKPIALSGHERSLTQIKFNLEGDLLFSVSKDSTPSVWYSHNGERLGTFDGHNGTVWCVDPRFDSKFLLTGSADNTCKLWDIKTGTQICSFATKSAVRACGWSYSGKEFFFSTDKAMGQQSTMFIYNLAEVEAQGPSTPPYLTIPSPASKITSAVWGPLDETIITGHENGGMIKWNAKSGEEIKRIRPHRSNINDIQYNSDMTVFITASKDNYAKILDTETFQVMKEFKTERPVNSACISSLKPQVLLGGGQDAMSVTTTAAKVGKFEATFYHMVYGEEIGRVKGHFGPINTLAFYPNGKGYASGGEDGYVRLHHFDPSYFEFEFET